MSGSDTVSKSQITVWVALAVAFVAGLICVIFSDELPYVRMQRVIEDIGIALIVASILGITIDRALKIELVRDVFNAAFQYVLPGELKQEIRKILTYRLICEQHHWLVQIESLDDAFVRVTSTLTRRIRNVGASSDKVRPYVHIDEWGFKGERSRVIECKITLDDGTVVVGTERPTKSSSILFEGDEQVIRPNHHVTVVSKWTEVRQSNDSVYLNLESPTKNPEIEVRAPRRFEIVRTFGSTSENVEHVGERAILTGTYLPLHYMVVRWWPKKSAASTQTDLPASV
jgi:hypothetical protein